MKFFDKFLTCYWIKSEYRLACEHLFHRVQWGEKPTSKEFFFVLSEYMTIDTQND